MKLCFIWHMHQPYYRDPLSGTYLLPWVRLHGCKDYLDMVTLADDFPSIRQCFNLVPSLLEQLQEYADGAAVDRHLELSRRQPADLSELEKLEITRQFFSANPPTMIEPYPRYQELRKLCQGHSGRELLARLNDQDYLDLQFWFNATWVDPTLRSEPRIRALFQKGRGYSEEDKQYLLDYQIKIIKQTIPAYRERQDEGRIEVSFSPYYHPILPLLVDTEIAKVAMPHATLPERRFTHPEDARRQLSTAAELYRDLFGRELLGMWPSEGSVSEAILPLLAEQGIRWIATDEEIYRASRSDTAPVRKGETKSHDPGFHRPLLVGESGQEVGILFRDHTLSDKIGFVYSSWDPERAARDFVDQLLKLESYLVRRGQAEPVVSIILDGENAWEYYQNDGYDFLSALFTGIEKSKKIETVLPRDLFSQPHELERLPRLFPGSWINHDFHVWIGHEEDNRAWDLLHLTRAKLVDFLNEHPEFADDKRESAWKEIYIAEGSDWCWWYGEDHHTDHFEIFDRLFRRHLHHVWDLIGASPPQALLRPLRQTLSRPLEYSEPSGWLSPIIDGRQTHFFEWSGAGRLECYRQGGAMHRADHLIYQILYGYDHENLYLRLDLEGDQDPTDFRGEIRLELITEARHQLKIDASRHDFAILNGGIAEDSVAALQVARDKIIELAIPQSALQFSSERNLLFSVALYRGEKEIEKWPSRGYISLTLPRPGETLFWEL